MAANDLRLDDGFSTTITLELNPTIKFWEKEVTPPGMTQGGGIDTTTMRNIEWRTMAPRALRSLTAFSATVAYATVIFDAQILAMLGVVQLVTVNFPDGSSMSFYGWLDEFTPGTNVEGEQPTATISVVPGNRHPTTGDEVAPMYTAPAESS